jgi:hypothetical protein
MIQSDSRSLRGVKITKGKVTKNPDMIPLKILHRKYSKSMTSKINRKVSANHEK